MINTGPGGADWFFRYGDVLMHRMFGFFEVGEEQERQRPSFEEVVVKKSETVMVGGPSEAFLPRDVREAIKRRFAERYGIYDLGFFLLYREGDNPRAQMVFSIFPEDYKDEGDFQRTLRELSWFLPRHYPVNAVRRSSGMAKDFQPL